MKVTSYELASLVSSSNFGADEMHVEECVQLAREEIVDGEYIMAKLVDQAWGREIHLGLDLNEEPMEGKDVDDQPTLIVKLPRACEYGRFLSILH